MKRQPFGHAGLRVARRTVAVGFALAVAAMPLRAADHTVIAGGMAPAAAAKALEGVDWDAAAVLEVDLADHHYAPSALRMKVGKPHILRLKNIGTVAHDMVGGNFFEIAAIRMTQTRVGRTVTPVLKSVYVRPKQEMEIWLVPTATGIYSFYCGIAGHRDGGMEGEIEVLP